MEQIIQNATDEALATAATLLRAIGEASIPEDVAHAVYDFHHELAALSGNVLPPFCTTPLSRKVCTYGPFPSKKRARKNVRCKDTALSGTPEQGYD